MRSFLLGPVLLAAGASAAAAAPLDVCRAVAEPVVDVHVHAYGQDPRFDRRIPNPATGAPNVATDGAGHRRATLAELKRLGIVRAIVSGADRRAQDAMAAADPARIRHGWAMGIPTAEDLAGLRRLHAEGRLEMIGEVAPQYEGIAPNDPRLEPLWALAEELRVPVGFHIGRGPPAAAWRGHPKHRAADGKPLLIEDVLVRHPKMKIFLMHAGFPWADDIEALLGEYPEVHVDLGAVHWAEHRPAFHRFLKRLIDGGFARRIMFGSDQMVWPDAIGQSLEAYREADYLSAEQRRDILFGNAVRFFGWTDLAGCGAG